MKTKMIYALLLVVFFVFANFVVAFPAPAQQAQTQAPAVRTPNAKWLQEFEEFNRRNLALGQKRAAFEATQQKEIDYLVGLSQRLTALIPAGYQFDGTTRLFVPIPPRPAVASPAPSIAPTSPSVSETK